MATSLASSIVSLFPLPQASPVRAAIGYLHTIQTTSEPLTPGTCQTIRDLNIDPSLYTLSKRAGAFSAAISRTSSSFLISPTAIQSSNPIVPPVFKAPPSSDQSDWTLVHAPSLQTRHEQDTEVMNLRIALVRTHRSIQICNAIIEGDQAQMVVQDMHLGKLQSALYGKENKKRDDCTKLFPEGKGRHLTNTEFIAQLEHA